MHRIEHFPPKQLSVTELLILLPLPPKYWDPKPATPGIFLVCLNGVLLYSLEFSVYLWLALNSWPSSCLRFPNAGVPGTRHRAQLLFILPTFQFTVILLKSIQV